MVQLDPIRAVFSVPSAMFVEIAQQIGETSRVEVLERYVPNLLLPTGETYEHQGAIAFADNQIDATTGTVAVYADFPNPKHVLLPGQYINAILHNATRAKLPAVPAAALMRTKDGEQVWVVGKDKRVSSRKIATGARVGTDYSVTSGLQEGELVVVGGVQKVKDGMVVTPTHAGAAAKPDPTAKVSDNGDK